MDNFLIDTVIDKINGQQNRIEQNENRMAELENKITEVSSQETTITKLAGMIEQMQNKMSRIVWPKEQLTELSFRIKLNNGLLANPVKNKQIIVHTAEKSIWIIVVLVIFLNISIMVSIDFNRKLDQYKTNDILWRAIKVHSKSSDLVYLQSIENLYNNDPDKFRSIVINEEFTQKRIIESAALKKNEIEIDSVQSSFKIKQHK